MEASASAAAFGGTGLANCTCELIVDSFVDAADCAPLGEASSRSATAAAPGRLCSSLKGMAGSVLSRQFLSRRFARVNHARRARHDTRANLCEPRRSSIRRWYRSIRAVARPRPSNAQVSSNTIVQYLESRVRWRLPARRFGTLPVRDAQLWSAPSRGCATPHPESADRATAPAHGDDQDARSRPPPFCWCCCRIPCGEPAGAHRLSQEV